MLEKNQFQFHSFTTVSRGKKHEIPGIRLLYHISQYFQDNNNKRLQDLESDARLECTETPNVTQRPSRDSWLVPRRHPF